MDSYSHARLFLKIATIIYMNNACSMKYQKRVNVIFQYLSCYLTCIYITNSMTKRSHWKKCHSAENIIGLNGIA